MPIVNDNILEHQERFIVNLEPLPGHEERIELVDTVKVVDIIDDDGESFINWSENIFLLKPFML